MSAQLQQLIKKVFITLLRFVLLLWTLGTVAILVWGGSALIGDIGEQGGVIWVFIPLVLWTIALLVGLWICRRVFLGVRPGSRKKEIAIIVASVFVILVHAIIVGLWFWGTMEYNGDTLKSFLEFLLRTLLFFGPSAGLQTYLLIGYVLKPVCWLKGR